MKAKRILVIDDNIVFLKAMSIKLRSFGYEVLTAVDGSAAVTMVREGRPDLILLDLNFPPDVAHGGGVAWNGLMILSWLKRMREAQNIPVIVVTAGEIDEWREECLAAGVLDVFVKPVDMEALAAAIHAALSGMAPEEEEPEPEMPPTPAGRILFIDQESDWLYMGTVYLTECGYEVFTADTPERALTQAASTNPDVIVLDLDVGDGAGLTVMNLMLATRPQVPVLLHSSRELSEAEVDDLKDQGAFDCLLKGTMEELLAAVGAALEASVQAQPAVPQVPRPRLEPAVPGIQTVLIVEDNVEFGDILRTFLEAHPFCVTRVTDGAEALRQLSAEDFDVILCDVALPSLSGEDLYQEVGQIKPNLRNRFIFMTGHHASPKMDNFIRRIGAVMLWKPFDLQDLLKAIEFLRRPGNRHAPRLEPTIAP